MQVSVIMCCCLCLMGYASHAHASLNIEPDGRLVRADEQAIRLAGVVPPSWLGFEWYVARYRDAVADWLREHHEDIHVVTLESAAQDYRGRPFMWVENGQQESLQAMLIRRGLGVFYPLEALPLKQQTILQQAEQWAYEHKAGVWRSSVKRFAAHDPEAILAYRNRFVVVEGLVQGVSVTKRSVYVNFGQDWHDDMTVAIRNENVAAIEQQWGQMEGWVGQEVAIKGWVESYNGPYIRMDHANHRILVK